MGYWRGRGKIFRVSLNRIAYFPSLFWLHFRKRLLCWAFFLLLVFPALSFAERVPANKYGGALVLSTISDPKSFNDITAKETSTTVVTSLIFEGLTTTDPDTLKVKPNLAERWEVSGDGLAWTFFLRQDVRWNDGVAFTSDDVVFTFQDLIYNDKIPSSARDIFTVDGKTFQIERINDYTVRFTLPVKFAPFLRAMGQAILPKHKLAQPLSEGRFNFTWGIDTPPSEIVGTGPFKLAEYRPGERIVFVPNGFYWKKSTDGDRLPYLAKVIYMIIPSLDMTVLKFLDGELDYCSLRGMDYPLLKPLEKKKNFTIYEAGPDFGSSFLVFNQNRGINPTTGKPYVEPVKLSWFTNREFRRAVAHAVDKKQMIDILNNGLGYPQDSPVSPSAGFFFNDKVENFGYDLGKARAMLKSAGFVDRDGDGVLEDPQGHKVEFNLLTNSNNQERIQIAAIIRHDLEKLGMRVNFLAMEFNTVVSKLNATFDWDAILLGLTGGVEPHFGKNVWDSSGQLHMWHPRQEKPSTPWEARIDEIFNAGVQELNEDKRKVLYDEFQRIAVEEQPFIYTILGSNIFAVRNKFGNLHPTSYGGAFHNIEQIYLLRK